MHSFSKLCGFSGEAGYDYSNGALIIKFLKLLNNALPNRIVAY
jgi:hypothetical protein